MSRATVLAEKIKDNLNATTFSQVFVATRKYRALYSLKDLKTLTVTVVFMDSTQTAISRISSLDSISVAIIVQKQVDFNDNTATDLLSSLLEEISDHFRALEFTEAYASWLSNSISVPFDPDDLTDDRLFTGVITLNYQVPWDNE